MSLIEGQPQYIICIRLALTQQEITLSCGCFGLTSLPMLKYEIITKLKESKFGYLIDDKPQSSIL